MFESSCFLTKTRLFTQILVQQCAVYVYFFAFNDALLFFTEVLQTRSSATAETARDA